MRQMEERKGRFQREWDQARLNMAKEAGELFNKPKAGDGIRKD
jgi:hypothetical protein